LNVSGNGLFSSDGMPDPTTTTSATFPPPSFRFDSESAPVDPYSVLDHITPSQSPAPGDYLHPPGFNLMQRRTSVSAKPISVDSENHQPLPVYPKTEDKLRQIKASTNNKRLACSMLCVKHKSRQDRWSSARVMLATTFMSTRRGLSGKRLESLVLCFPSQSLVSSLKWISLWGSLTSITICPSPLASHITHVTRP